MATQDIIVVGAGISGLAFAAQAARAGRSVLLLEREPRVGGALHSAHAKDGFWVELGGHTCYNSYGGLIDLLEGANMLGELQAREKPILRFLDGDRVLWGTNLFALLGRMNLLGAAVSFPRALFSKPAGKSVRGHYALFVGEKNFAKVLSPMLAAVVSQRADDFPADMLFKSRPRRKDILRSFTMKQGLGSIGPALAGTAGVTARTGAGVARLERDGAGYAVVLDDGTRERAEVVALATSPAVTAGLLGGVAPEAAGEAGTIAEMSIDSVGVVVRADRVPLPKATFFIPVSDIFHSVVTRDVVPDPTWRGFALHFHAGLSEEEQLARITRLLRVGRGELAAVERRRSVLPRPVLGHHETIARLDRLTAGTGLALTGNWFGGLGIEDCVQRSLGEFQRIQSR